MGAEKSQHISLKQVAVWIIGHELAPRVKAFVVQVAGP